RTTSSIATAEIPRRAAQRRSSAGDRVALAQLAAGAQMSSTVYLNQNDLLAPPFARRIQMRSLVIGLIFSVLAIIGGLVTPAAQFWHAYLLGIMGWLGLSLGSM